MSEKLRLSDLPIEGKTILMRVDFNVPLNAQQEVSDDTRIQAALPSICHVLDRGGTLVLMSHLGRPGGMVQRELSLAPCARHLSLLLEREVQMAPDCVGADVEAMVHNLARGSVLLLENLRFHRAETQPEENSDFARALSAYGDYYVNEAFSASHRSHSSITEITKYFPKRSASGFLLQKEIDYLGKTLQKPQRPFYALVGGAKVSSKIAVLQSLCEKVDALFIGGAMVFTFLKAQGIAVGDSLWEEEHLETAEAIMRYCEDHTLPFFLPSDTVIADQVASSATIRTVHTADGIPDGFMGVDLGPQALEEWTREFADAGTLLWNGPFGVFEVPPFDRGTKGVAQALSRLNATTIVGGGDSIAAVKATGVASSISHISTGGGACLEYIQFGKLPGIEALSERHVSHSL